jgi:hypothetical protein
MPFFRHRSTPVKAVAVLARELVLVERDRKIRLTVVSRSSTQALARGIWNQIEIERTDERGGTNLRAL